MLPRVYKRDLDRLHSYQPRLQVVEDATGVPWEAVAALWWRESFSETPPHTPGGSFQFDPAPSAKQMEFLLTRYSNLDEKHRAEIIKKGVNNFDAAAMLSACHGRHHCTPIITPTVSDEDILDFFWGYNGKAPYQKNPRGSFYVYNGFDVLHDGLLIIGSIPDKKAPGGRRRIRRRETRPGAFIVYKQLRGELR